MPKLIKLDILSTSTFKGQKDNNVQAVYQHTHSDDDWEIAAIQTNKVK